MFNRNIIKIDMDEMDKAKKYLRFYRILGFEGKYRTSSSGRGYHLELFVKGHTKEENWILRYMLGDCWGRLRIDIRRLQSGLKEFDILFSKKGEKKVSKWRRI